MATEVGFESAPEVIGPPTPPIPIETPQISSSPPPQIPTEIVSDEEMSLIEAAFSFAFASRSSPTSLHVHRNPPSVTSITLLSKRNCVGDIEDGIGIGRTQKKKKFTESLLYRFRRKTGLFVTDITSTEWCEKQQEFFLLRGKPKASKAMKAGSARHAVLEAEVITTVEVLIRSSEERWALKFINFIHGTNQLFLEGLTRELPILGFVEGVCVVGVIDEIRETTLMENRHVPTLVETKTRSQNNLPSEPQQRNGRLQLMCYKYLWDHLVANPFPTSQFLKLFSLNPNYVLSKEIQESAIQAGVEAQTLHDVLTQYQYICSKLPKAHNELLLRYEYQKDQSLIGENQYLYDSDWVTGQIKSSIEFWKGEREANYVLEDERWKCCLCKYASMCPVNAKSEEHTAHTTKE
ncbi:exonuclease V, chloroplastic [Lactuca sativa]|uniref:Exonuclease V n=1 Tax=Lactuca sativa TaxID=4236 RepID=A0A9R1XQA3_LACSA|nr:exonuclease V, chloroplastic [Lactuca sativa]XP_042755106.1 exonuclease V, chloroplastic [Lactuca sativa]KAJ0221394.1 hypothetical protein LSAT_V11C200068440 [Lactuca sativa]